MTRDTEDTSQEFDLKKGIESLEVGDQVFDEASGDRFYITEIHPEQVLLEIEQRVNKSSLRLATRKERRTIDVFDDDSFCLAIPDRTTKHPQLSDETLRFLLELYRGAESEESSILGDTAIHAIGLEEGFADLDDDEKNEKAIRFLLTSLAEEIGSLRIYLKNKGLDPELTF